MIECGCNAVPTRPALNPKPVLTNFPPPSGVPAPTLTPAPLLSDVPAPTLSATRLTGWR